MEKSVKKVEDIIYKIEGSPRILFESITKSILAPLLNSQHWMAQDPYFTLCQLIRLLYGLDYHPLTKADIYLLFSSIQQQQLTLKQPSNHLQVKMENQINPWNTKHSKRMTKELAKLFFQGLD